MANNYTLFSTLIECDSKEQRRWLLDAIDLNYPCEAVDGPAPTNRPCVWIHSDGDGNLEELVDIVCQFQIQFDIAEPWALEYAQTCSKPQIDEFGGGAVVCHKGEAFWESSASFVMRKLREITGESL